MAVTKIKYDMYSQTGEKIKQIDLNPAIFAIELNNTLVHQVAVAQMSNARTVLAHTKDRSEVRGGGKKPWRQKGTGRARHGSSRSPIWVGGGVTFGPTKDRNFAKKINKKMKTKALFMCLSDRVNDKDLVLVDQLTTQNNKTKEFVKSIENLKDVLNLSPKYKKIKTKATDKKSSDKSEVKQSVNKKKKFDIKNYRTSILVVVDKKVNEVVRIAKNISGVTILGANSINILDILKHKNILITQGSLEVIEKTYLK